MDFVLALELLLFAILMGLSAFFSSSETALFSLDKRQLERMRHDDNPRSELIERLLSEPRRLIVTILIGNEFVNVTASVISAAIVIRLLGAESKLLNLLIMIPILLLVGEITPKTVAIRNNVAFATVQSRPIELFAKLITPLRTLIRLISDFFTTLIVGKQRTQGNIVTEDLVRTLAREAVGEGVLDQHEAHYIDQIFSFGNKTLEDIQTPRSNIVFLPASMPPKQVLASLRGAQHTKVPVYGDNSDEILGVLHSRDLLGVDPDELEEHPDTWLKLMREPHIVPEQKSVAELFHTFRKRKTSVALTVDEFGGITGLVTMEDLLECIFGNIPSLSGGGDKADVDVRSDGSRHVRGTMTLEQFNEEFEEELDGDGFGTIAGMILHLHGELPPKGTVLISGELEFTIHNVGKNSIREIAVRRIDADSGPAKSKPQKKAGSGKRAQSRKNSAKSKKTRPVKRDKP